MLLIAAERMEYLLYDFTGTIPDDDVFPSVSISFSDLLAEQIILFVWIARKCNARQPCHNAVFDQRRQPHIGFVCIYLDIPILFTRVVQGHICQSVTVVQHQHPLLI